MFEKMNSQNTRRASGEIQPPPPPPPSLQPASEGIVTSVFVKQINITYIALVVDCR